jgi:hypothetical protein
MPPGGVGRIDRKLIHPSAWKKNSAKSSIRRETYAPIEPS